MMHQPPVAQFPHRSARQIHCPAQSSTGTRRTKNLQDFRRLLSQTAPLVGILTAVSLSLF